MKVFEKFKHDEQELEIIESKNHNFVINMMNFKMKLKF